MVGEIAESAEECAPGVLKAVAGAEQQRDNVNDANKIGEKKGWWRRRESNPAPRRVHPSKPAGSRRGDVGEHRF